MTVETLLSKQNKSFVIGVMTVDNTFANNSVGKVNDLIFPKKMINERRGKRMMYKINKQQFRNEIRGKGQM